MTTTAKSAKPDFKALYKDVGGRAFIAYFVAMGLVGAFTPADILTRYTWTQPFTDFMATLIPQINAVTALGIDADINRFYFSVMWACSPIIAISVFLAYRYTRARYLRDPTHMWRMPLGKALVSVSSAIFMGALAFFVFDIFQNDQNRLLRGIFGSPLGRFVALPAFAIGPVLFWSVATFWLLGWITGYIPRNIRRQNELERSHAATE